MLCELDEEAASLLKRAEHWLEVAVRENERTDDQRDWDYDDAERFRVLGLCRWIRNQQVDQESFSSACDAAQPLPPEAEGQARRGTFASDLRSCRALRRASVHFRACKRLAAPGRLKGIKCPGKICYLFATHGHGLTRIAALETAFRSFLKFTIPVCLNLRGGGFSGTNDVPTWTLIEERYFGGVSRTVSRTSAGPCLISRR